MCVCVGWVRVVCVGGGGQVCVCVGGGGQVCVCGGGQVCVYATNRCMREGRVAGVHAGGACGQYEISSSSNQLTEESGSRPGTSSLRAEWQ